MSVVIRARWCTPRQYGRSWVAVIARCSHARGRKATAPRPEQADPQATHNGRPRMTDASIWEHVSANVPKNASGLKPEGVTLPDAEDPTAPYVPGAADGVRIVNRRVTPDEKAALDIAELAAAAMTSRKPRG